MQLLNSLFIVMIYYICWRIQINPFCFTTIFNYWFHLQKLKINLNSYYFLSLIQSQFLVRYMTLRWVFYKYYKYLRVLQSRIQIQSKFYKKKINKINFRLPLLNLEINKNSYYFLSLLQCLTMFECTSTFYLLINNFLLETVSCDFGHVDYYICVFQ